MICFQPFKKYFNFFDRANRWEFWSFYIFVIIVQCILTVIEKSSGITYTSGFFEGTGVPTILFLLVTAIPMWAVSVRRLHDTDRRGWWILIAFVPAIGILWLFILYCLKGTPEDNRFGPPPR